jgi:rhamnose utilization protein RhaD (predicted bifunctional aldolase and dehydrogenase)/NAD(P)-dependent dehydrogenase (short-subunit alcohol dehydrogenase family)
MRSRYIDADAPTDALAQRQYAAGLIAHDSAVLPQGSSHSMKGRVDIVGVSTDVVWVSADNDPSSFVALRADALRRAAQLDLQGGDRHACLLRERVDPMASAPTSDALLHAMLPARFVDVVEADGLLQVLAQSDAAGRCKEVFGDEVVFVARGASPAKRYAEHTEAHGAPKAMLLDKRGLVTWGDDAKASYESLVSLIDNAQETVASQSSPVGVVEHRGEDLNEVRRSVALAMRGGMRRATHNGWIAHWRTSPDLLRFTRRRDVQEVSRRGCVLTRHAALLGPWPLVLNELGGGNIEKLPALIDEALDGHVRAVRSWIEQHGGDRALLAAVDPWPRVVLVPDLGVLTLGRDDVEARQIGNVYQHAVRIIEGAEALGSYLPSGDEEQLAAIANAQRDQPLPHQNNGGPLNGRVVLVTGAASGIGMATSRAMLAAGAHVVITDRDPRVVEAVSEWPQARYPDRFRALICDVTSERDCRRAVEGSCDAFGGIDVLLSNAGTAPSGGLHTESGDSALRASIDVNLLGHQRIARATTEAMLAQGSGGVLLFNASRIAFHQGPEFGPYAVPKAALIALMRQYAIDLGRHGIRSNAVNADRVRTQLFAPGVVEQHAHAKGISPSEYFRANLLCRETSSDQVADAFIFLATATATTGCIVTVDGGNPAAFPR